MRWSGKVGGRETSQGSHVMSHGLGCEGDGPGKNEIGEASERKDGRECVTD